MNAYQKTFRNLLIPMLAAWFAGGVLPAQTGTAPFAAFPTQSVKDGRFLGFACAGLATLEQNVQVMLAAPASVTAFDLNLFDGETGGLDPSGKKHWDLGTRQLKFSLYADPLRTGAAEPADLIGEWYGNSANATAGTDWTSSAASMPDNDWWTLHVTTTEVARAISGNYLYVLVIDTDGACTTGEQLESSLKIATSYPVTFSVPHFGLVAGLRQTANDLPIIYPGSTPTAPATGSFLTAPTTYDGTFDIFFALPGGETELRLFDGDFDFGASTLIGNPSGVALDPCGDTDDPDTPAGYAGFPFSPTGAAPEGVQGPGVPPDDNYRDVFRRGEPGDPNHVGCVRYEVTDPEGHVYANDNPSGSFEWEQFLIASSESPVLGEADAVYVGSTLPVGMWRVRIIGLDLANLNFWYANSCATRPSRDPEPGEDPDDVPRVVACPDESVELLGEFVWTDTKNPGVPDRGEPGIPGVLMELVRSSDGRVVATTRTGDATSPNWAACRKSRVGTDDSGLYCFGRTVPGAYQIRAAASNFNPGQPLAGRSSTTVGQGLNIPPSGNVLNLNFGYTGARSH